MKNPRVSNAPEEVDVLAAWEEPMTSGETRTLGLERTSSGYRVVLTVNGASTYVSEPEPVSFALSRLRIETVRRWASVIR